MFLVKDFIRRISLKNEIEISLFSNSNDTSVAHIWVAMKSVACSAMIFIYFSSELLRVRCSVVHGNVAFRSTIV